jgi:N-acetylglucosaminyl-diphospho-decaprenol L-rhamnosyltransferase
MGSSLKFLYSIVSHGQIRIIDNLLSDLAKLDLSDSIIVLTINIPEDLSILDRHSKLPLVLIRNKVVKGFGENHNAAFQLHDSFFFIVINPDIRITNSLNYLFSMFNFDERIGIVVPKVVNSKNEVEDSVRRYPTLSSLFFRFIFRRRLDYKIVDDSMLVDWAAGMFMVFKSAYFREIGGFDIDYFMYLEDVDVCLRFKKNGYLTLIEPRVIVTHEARRMSRKSLKFTLIHFKSYITYSLKHLEFFR